MPVEKGQKRAKRANLSFMNQKDKNLFEKLFIKYLFLLFLLKFI